MALGTNVLWSSLKHIIWHLWGTMELQIHTKYTKCQGTTANGAMKLFRWHLAPVLWSSLKHITWHLASGELWNYRYTPDTLSVRTQVELWSYIRHTGGHLTLVSCGAISNTLGPVGCGAISSILNDTWFQSTSNTIEHNAIYSTGQQNTV